MATEQGPNEASHGDDDERQKERAFALVFMMEDIIKGLQPMDAYKKEIKERHSLFPKGYESVKEKLEATKERFWISIPSENASAEVIEQWVKDNPIVTMSSAQMHKDRRKWLDEKSGFKIVDDDELDEQLGAMSLEIEELEEKKDSLEAFVQNDADKDDEDKTAEKSSFAWRFYDFISTFPF